VTHGLSWAVIHRVRRRERQDGAKIGWNLFCRPGHAKRGAIFFQQMPRADFLGRSWALGTLDGGKNVALQCAEPQKVPVPLFGRRLTPMGQLPVGGRFVPFNTTNRVVASAASGKPGRPATGRNKSHIFGSVVNNNCLGQKEGQTESRGTTPKQKSKMAALAGERQRQIKREITHFLNGERAFFVQKLFRHQNGVTPPGKSGRAKKKSLSKFSQKFIFSLNQNRLPASPAR